MAVRWTCGSQAVILPCPNCGAYASEKHENAHHKGLWFAACWNAVLARINGAIEARRAAGEALPPPPKTAIAGPEYFGLTHPAILPQLEALDSDRICVDYWAGKQARTCRMGKVCRLFRMNPTVQWCKP